MERHASPRRVGGAEVGQSYGAFQSRRGRGRFFRTCAGNVTANRSDKATSILIEAIRLPNELETRYLSRWDFIEDAISLEYVCL